MIRFFRSIRQKLLVENRFTKYLVYALGEIVLVVIGILIALQVNNWNEHRKSLAREQKYLVAIRGELRNNLASLNREKARLAAALEAQRMLIRLVEAETDTVSERFLSTLLGRSFSDEIALPYEHGVFTELLSTGGLSDLTNDSIKTEIASWDGKMRDVELQEAELALYRNTITQYFIDHIDFKTMFADPGRTAMAKDGRSPANHSNLHLLHDQTFENYLLLYQVLGDVQYEMKYPALEADIQTLLDRVEREIDG